VLKRTMAKILTTAMVLTQGFNVMTTEAAAKLEIDKIAGSKSNIYLTLSEEVFVSAGSPVVATITPHGGEAINATATLKGEEFMGTDLVITPETALSFDKTYELKLEYDGDVITENFKYDILMQEDFSDDTSAKTKMKYYGNHNQTVDGMLMRQNSPYYATYAMPNLATPANAADDADGDGMADRWTDYTVEFDYIDSKTMENIEAESYTIKLASYFYVPTNCSTGGSWWLNEGSLVALKDTASVAITANPSTKTRYMVKDVTDTYSEADYISTTGGNADFCGKDVTYSASIFGTDVYNTVTDIADGTVLYSSYSQISDNLRTDEGTFAVLACVKANNNDGHPTYIDNVVAYKLEKLDIAYGENESFKSYGSKNQLVFEFENEVLDSDVEITDLSGNVINATSSYSNKLLAVKPAKDLDVDKFYYVTVKYGLGLKYSKKILVGFDVLFEENFDGKTDGDIDNVKFENNNVINEVTADGKLMITQNPYYATQVFKNYAIPEGTEWTDYTVEFQYEKDTDTEIKSVALTTLFYVSNDAPWYLNMNETKYLAVVAEQTGAYYYSEATGGKASLGYTVNEGTLQKSFDKTVIYSASLFGNNLYSNVKDLEGNVLSDAKAVVPALNKTSGRFAIQPWTQPENSNPMIDNVLCYKLKEIESPAYTDNENVVINANKEVVVAEFENDVIDAEVVITEVGSDAEISGVTSKYTTSNKTVIANLSTPLDTNKKYTISVKYGLECEKSVSKNIGFKVLFSDDFDDYNRVDDSYSTNKWKNINASRVGYDEDGNMLPGIVDGKLVANKAQSGVYPIFSNTDCATDEWSGYTVEYIVKKTDNNGDNEKWTGFFNYMYTDEELLKNAYNYDKTMNDAVIETGAVCVADILTCTNSTSIYVQKADGTVNSTDYKVAETASPGDTLDKELKISFGHVGDYFMSNMKETSGEAPLKKTNLSYIGDSFYHGKGGFAISIGNKCGYVDDVVAYKMYEIGAVEASCTALVKGTDSVSLDVKLINADGKEVKPVLALYGDYGRLIKVVSGTDALEQTITTKVDPAAVKTATLFVLDSLSDITPYSCKLIVD